MDGPATVSPSEINRGSRPLRRRGVSFNVLPLREEPTVSPSPPAPILVDYASIRERKQLNLSNFLQSDNPVTFVLYTLWHALCLLGQLFLLPYTLVKHLYLLMLQVYGVRRPNLSTSTSDLFSISSSQASTPQQRPIVWLLTLIDYFIVQLTRLPDAITHAIDATRQHIDGTILKSFHLIDSCTSHQITHVYSMLRRLFFEEHTDMKSKAKK